MIINDHYWPHQSLHCKGSGISLAESVLTRWCSNQRKLWGGGGGVGLKQKNFINVITQENFFLIYMYMDRIGLNKNWPDYEKI